MGVDPTDPTEDSIDPLRLLPTPSSKVLGFIIQTTFVVALTPFPGGFTLFGLYLSVFQASL